MKGKKILISISIACALLIPVTVFAATSNAPVAKSVRSIFGINITTLNDQQKADVKTYTTKMADVQKEFVNKMVANGTLTKEQGDAEIKKIDDALKNGEAIPMFDGGGKGHGNMRSEGSGMMFGIDQSKLTDQQKADFKTIYSKMADAQKEYLKKEVASSLITQVQADSIIAKIDESIKNNECPNDFEFGMGNRGMMENDQNTLTTQQKTDLQTYKQKMTDLQKELINKAVSNGAITQEQGKQAIDRIDSPKTFEKGTKDGMMGKGFGRGQQKGIESQNTTTQQ